MDPVALVISECITVSSAMRKHSRWAHSSVAAILGTGHSPEEDTKKKVTLRNAAALGVRLIATGAVSPGGSNAVASDAKENHALQSRWGLRGKKGKSLQDNPLMSAFTRLRADLKTCTDIRSFDTPALLHPFLQVIRSSSTSAPITSLALVAITKFFSYNIITKQSPRASLAMQYLSAAITHCRFEATDSAADEVVLLRILKLMEDMMTRPEGELLGDQSVCELMETGLSMCCQARLSEVLRRSAEMAMVSMCQVIFGRLSSVPDEVATETQRCDADQHSTGPDPLKMIPLVDGDTVSSQTTTAMGQDAIDPVRTGGRVTPTQKPSDVTSTTAAEAVGSADEIMRTDSLATADENAEVKPYSTPSIKELFRVLIDLLDPHNPQHSDAMRIMSLRIIDVALEVAGPAIAIHRSLAQLAQDDLCRYLFQLVRSENIGLLASALRVAGTLLMTCRHVLKLQQELYLSYLVSCLHPKVDIPTEAGIDPSLYAGIPKTPKLSTTSSGRSTPIPVKDRQRLGLEGGIRKPEAREAMVESLCSLVRIPTFMMELFVNYDCEVDTADLCEDLVGLLSRNAFPDSATWSTTSVPPLCLDALLCHVRYLADRLDCDPALTSGPDPAVLQRQRETKRITIRGAQKFNEDPKGGIMYLAAQSIISDPNDAHAIAAFLKGTSRVSKQVLGEYLSKRSNETLLEAHMDLFNWKDKDVVEALRELLGSFRLPGEAALIDRILTIFSQKYMSAAAPSNVADKDSLFILTYAIIMLNTNLYNPNVKTPDRMSSSAFAKNLSGCNGGQNFDEDYLTAIYTAIEQNEIILPEEHESKHAFDFAWKELLTKTTSAGPLVSCTTNVYDAEIFRTTWRPIIATLSYVFMSATDDAVFSRIVTGFDQCARIATKYGLTEVMDRIIYCLASISSLITDSPPNTTLNTEVQMGQSTVMVSELAVRLGRDYRAQLATVVLFRILHHSAPAVRSGWEHVVTILARLFVNSLTRPLTGASAKLDIPPIPLQPTSSVVNRDQRLNETGLLSAFTSYLAGYAADEPPEPSDEEVENTLCTVDCIGACSIPELMQMMRTLPLEPLTALVNALLDAVPDGSATATYYSRNGSLAPSRKQHTSDVDYDPAVLYCLELATTFTLRDEESVKHLGEDLTATLQSIIREVRQYHPIMVCRVITYTFEVLASSYMHSFIRAPVILHSVSSLSPDILEYAAIPIVLGLDRCVSQSLPLRTEMTSSPDFWAILQRYHQHPEAAALALDMLHRLVTETPPIVSADNFEFAVALANDIASAGALASDGAQDSRTARKGAAQRNTSTPATSPTDDPFVMRGVKATNLIQTLSGHVATLISQSYLEQDEAWAAYWSPMFSSLTTQCLNPSRQIRHHALTILQRALLSSDIATSDHKEWASIFNEVLFPLVERLLKPEVYRCDPVGMAQTRVQAAMLLCKVFLHYLVLLSEWDQMTQLWLRILDLLDRMMNSGQDQSLAEAIPESLKNILLVMASGGYIRRPRDDPSKEQLWTETQKRLGRFLPSLFEEVLPPDADEVRETLSADPTTIATSNQAHTAGEPTRREDSTNSQRLESAR
ncbi:GDP/GTP exchange factor for ARF [Ascosphaera acerosa]|nr:GDP/GTP exchange factor for ARF [Ascosphaera acerosa]